MPEQLPLNEILNEEERIFKSWISVEEVDRQGEILPIDTLLRAMPTYVKRGGVLMDQHSNRHVGKLLNYEKAIHPAKGKEALLGTFQVFKDTEMDNKIWNDIKAGKKTGISVGGHAVAKAMLLPSGDAVKVLTNFSGYELSLVDRPANPDALITEVNYVAKADQPSPEDEKVELCLKAGASSPWAICTAAVGRDDQSKYEKCVLQVKERLGIAKDAGEPSATSEADSSKQVEKSTQGETRMAENEIKKEVTEMPKEEVKPEVKQEAPVEEKPAVDPMEKLMALLMQISEKLDKVLESKAATPEAPAVEVTESAKSEPVAKQEVAKGLVGETPQAPTQITNTAMVGEKPFTFADIVTGKVKHKL